MSRTGFYKAFTLLGVTVPQIMGVPAHEAAATAAANESKIAKDAAQLSAGIFASTAAGLAVVANDGYFSVPSAESNEYLILYKNTAGVAVEQKRYPSTTPITKILDGDFTTLGFSFRKMAVESGYAWALCDANNKAAILVGFDGTVTIPKFSLNTLINTLNSTVGELSAGLFSSLGFSFKKMAVESGYAWALCDAANKAAILVALDGSVSLPKYDKAAYIPQVMIADTGYVWAVLDSNKRLGLGLKADGSLVFSKSQYLTPSRNLWCLGDSLTAGAGSQVTWREALPALLTVPRTITNWAIGGQTSTEIAARAGAYYTLITLTSNTIPTSGAITVTARTVNAITSQGSQNLTGTLNGIAGTLSRDGSDNYTFTRTTAGAATYTAPKSPFIPDIQTHDFDTLIIFLGRNNLSAPADIMRDIELCVGLQKTVEKRFLIITPPNGGTITTGVSTNEGTGTSTLTNIKAVEDWAVQKYGDRVLKSREFSYQFNNGSADDLDDVSKETVPRSLRIDTVHWTTAFHSQVAAWVANQINSRGW